MANIVVLGFKWAIMMTMLFLILLLCCKFFIAVKGNIQEKNNRAVFGKITVVLAAVFIVRVLMLSFNANRLPIDTKYCKQYIMEVNEIKENSRGTKVKLGKALMDLNSVTFNIGVKGKDKLVAVELKKSLQDKEVIKEFTGFWLGNRFSYEFNGLGIGYDSDTFIDTIYILCYLSNGEEIYFKLEDKNNLKDKTEKIFIQKDIESNGSKVRIKTLTRALNFTELEVVSDVGYFDLKVDLLQHGKVFESTSGVGGGGRFSFSFAPIDSEDITIRCTVKNLNKEFLIKVK